jgi:hypothetical protein
MIGFACDVAARTAAARVPDLIAEALAADHERLAGVAAADGERANEEEVAS